MRLVWVVMDTAMSISDLDPRGADVPFFDIDSVGEAGEGATRHTLLLENQCPLESLLINKSSDILVVVLHGATDRNRTVLPRFEWLSTLRDLPLSSLYFSDATLSADPLLQLAWYTGWRDINLHELIARRIERVVRALGVKTVVVAGSSGGGFAALQISSHLPDSIALPFNPQTDISRYKVGGTGMGPQKYYARNVMPHLVPGGVEDLEGNPEWICPLGERLSAVVRYSTLRENRVVIVQNKNEFHLADHFEPFVSAALNAGNLVEEVLYSGPSAHVVPSRELFARQIMRVAHNNADELQL